MQNYNLIQKFLHDIVLGKDFINKSLFELEKILYYKVKNIEDNSHIFITGLPRSGTTSLLNFIYSSGEFGSLKYSNMPFIFSPNFSKLFNKNNIKKKERLHMDGISFDLNSPEAFDEVFFRNNDMFIKDELIKYLNLILLSENKDKYLSKNNLNYKRIDLISSILKNSIFLIPIREPLQHSFSLLNQHLHFKKLQKNDDFIRRYMNYLGHNEFGFNHKAWNKPIYFHDNNSINYWLEQWFMFYNDIVLNVKSHENCKLIIYEELYKKEYVKNLIKEINLENYTKLNLNFFKCSNKKIKEQKFDIEQYAKASSVYKKLGSELSVF